MLVESGERVAEFCAKSVRVHGIKFLENKCLVLKYEGIKGVLLKYVKLLDWTTLKVDWTTLKVDNIKSVPTLPSQVLEKPTLLVTPLPGTFLLTPSNASHGPPP